MNRYQDLTIRARLPGVNITQGHPMITVNTLIRVTAGAGPHYSGNITVRRRAGCGPPAIRPWTSTTVFRAGWTALPTTGLAETLLMRFGVVSSCEVAARGKISDDAGEPSE